MALKEDIFSTLRDDAGTRAALGLPAVRPDDEVTPVYPGRAPDAEPVRYIVWQLVGTSTESSHDDSTEFEDALAQFSCVAESYDAAADLAKAVMAAFGALTDLTSGGKCVVEGQRDLYDMGTDVHARAVEVRFLHNPLAA